MPPQTLHLNNLSASEPTSTPSSAIVGPGLVVVAGSLLLAFSALRKYRTNIKDKRVATGSEPPFPASALPILDTTTDLLANDHRLYDWLTDLCLEFRGQPFRIKALGLAQIVVLSSPDHFEQVLRTDFANFEKGATMTEAMHDLLGDGIFATDGAAWYHQRKTISRLFTARTLRESISTVVHGHLAELVHEVDRLTETGAAFDLSKYLHDFTLETITEIALGVRLDALSSTRSDAEGTNSSSFQRAFDAAQRQISIRMTRPAIVWKFQRYWNLAGEATLKNDIKTVNNAVLEAIAKSLHLEKLSHQSTAPPSIVSLFLDSMEAKPDREHGFDPTYLRDIVLNIMVAGRDTTAQTLAWFFYCLNQHPHVTNKIRDEIQQHTPELLAQRNNTSSQSQFASMEQVAKLTYLDAAIKETLRLYPAVPLNIRTAVRDTLLADGTLLKTGTLVGLPTYALGRMPHVWGPNALAYDPDRWFDQTTGKPLVVSAFQFNAFHGGPRQCIGQQLAMLEMKIVAVALLTRFDVVVEAPESVTYARSLTLPMKHPFMVKATQRQT